jgi:hypothetical protein
VPAMSADPSMLLSGAVIRPKIREKPCPKPLSYHVGGPSARSARQSMAGSGSGDNVDNKIGDATDQVPYTLQCQGERHCRR